MVWIDGTVPEDCYKFQVAPEGQDFSEWAMVDLDETPDAYEVLKWIYHFQVLQMHDRDVCIQEELRFSVHEVESSFQRGKWEAKLSMFDFRQQFNVTYRFKCHMNA